MATIRTAIMIDDRMSGAFRAMNNALNIVINSFADLQDATHQSVDVSGIQTARDELARAGATLDQIEQEIRDADRQQQHFNNSLHGMAGAIDSAYGKIKSMVGAYVGLRTIKAGMDATDTYASNQARLSLIVDEPNVDLSVQDAMNAKLQETKNLQEKIYGAAQRSRGAYNDMVNTVAKLGLLAGDAFSNNDELVSFTELMQKSFKISGASTQESTNAMCQLTQAMASGRLQGDEYRSIIENAPMLANAIADYCGVSKGELKELSSDGEISAEIIKAAVFNMAEDVESKFAEMPMTFGDAWTSIKNTATMQAQDVMQYVSNKLNSNGGQAMIQGITSVTGGLIAALGMVLSMVIAVSGFVGDNWSIIEPIILGICTALGIYAGYLAVTNGLELISEGLKIASCLASYAHAAATGTEASATAVATAAQYGFNTALLACPITWIVVGIIALITILYAAVAAVNKFAGTSYSATGVVCGAFMWLLSVIGNIFIALGDLILGVVEWLINIFITFANFLGNIFTNPISSIIYAFRDMGDSVLRILENIASAIDTVFGSNLSSAVSGWRSGLTAMADSAVKKYAPNEKYEKIFDNVDLSMKDFGINRFDNTDAYNSGYKFGKGIDDKIGNALDFKLGDYGNEAFDYASIMDGIGQGVGDTAKNTGKTADAVSKSNEDLAYLRDIAEQETINRFTTAEIKVDMGGVKNIINNNADVDGIAELIAEKCEEELQIVAEGVHE